MTTVDVGDVCRLLGRDSGELADVFRREAARHLRIVATTLDQGFTSVDDALEAAVDWLVLSQLFETAWLETHDDDALSESERRESVEAVSRGTEATPSHDNTAVAAEQEDSR